MDLRSKLLLEMPELRAFLSNRSKSVCESALEAFSSLTTNSGKKSSMHMQFYHECKSAGNFFFFLHDSYIYV